jgi:hypothetical protein
MRTAQIAVAAGLALAATTAEAQLFKCVQGGRTVYQDAPCDDASKQSTVRAPTPGSAPPPPAPAESKGAAPSAPATASSGGGGGAALDVVAGFAICSERVPNFQRKYSDAYEGWKMRNAAAVSRLSNEPDASQFDARMRDERARPAEESIAERCADVATTIQPPREAGTPRVVK